ncbi:MAG: ABC transporter ATP-binding protein [Chloroflexi bacterium]|nr:MAG: ABC transporter ATP-binding protein [Chloroflexota bacterium]
MAGVALSDVTKRFGTVEAVSHVSLHVEEGEFFSLLGPSGCGKTTMLRMLAGFISPTAGSISIGGINVTELPPEKRDVGIVFQNYAIFPHMNVYDNIGFGLRMRKVARPELDRRVRAALEQVGLRGYENRYQREMSGGEQQRVALARVLVTQPRILLLDEPLSALDKKLREEMKYWIRDLHAQLGITAIYVTHDQGEALTMSDRIAVMRNGAVEQVGTPREVYEQPQTHFVTDFIGESNILPARVLEVDHEYVRLTLAGFSVMAQRRDVSAGQQVSLVVRPEHVVLGLDAERRDLNQLTGRVTKELYHGSLIRYELQVGEHSLVAESQNTLEQQVFPLGAEISVGWYPSSCSLLLD